jgi:hypothetical protein
LELRPTLVVCGQLRKFDLDADELTPRVTALFTPVGVNEARLHGVGFFDHSLKQSIEVRVHGSEPNEESGGIQPIGDETECEACTSSG